MLFDFHTHSFHSDGVLSPIELIRRAVVNGYNAIAITDHVAIGSLDRIIKEISADCALAKAYWDILAVPGVELTHIPPQAISDVAQKAKEFGACIVVVHGETTVEPVEKGTNLAAVKSSFVDILAHPGLITVDEAAQAAQNGVFLELTARRGHSTTNSHVASVSKKAQAKLIVNSDAHKETDLLSLNIAQDIINQAGVAEQEYQQILEYHPLQLIERIKK